MPPKVQPQRLLPKRLVPFAMVAPPGSAACGEAALALKTIVSCVLFCASNGSQVTSVTAGTSSRYTVMLPRTEVWLKCSTCAALPAVRMVSV